MTSIVPPRFAEAVLESLGAANEFRDAIIGDLAQEFAERHQRYGTSAARRWYYGETIRTTPHLLRNWLANANAMDFGQLLNVVALSLIAILTIEMLVVVAGNAVVNSISPRGQEWMTDPVRIVLMSAAVALFHLCGGYIAASMHARAPLIASIAHGVVYMTIASVMIALSPRTGPIQMPSLALVALAAAAPVVTTLGGLLRIKHGGSTIASASQT